MLFVKLSTFYLFYFALLGVMAPYMGLYFESRGLSLTEIGQLSAILMLTKVFAPNIWAEVADRIGHRLFIVRLGALLSLLSFTSFFFAEKFWQFAVIIFAYSFFWNAILAQYEVITLNNLGGQLHRYSQVRLWGSVGFILAVLICGWLFDVLTISLFPWMLLLAICGIVWASFFSLAEPTIQAEHRGKTASIFQLVTRPYAAIFFGVCLLLQISHGAYYTYFSIYMEALGYSESDIGLFWALGVAAEVAIFVVMHRWQAKHSVVQIMLIALLLTAVRWCLIGVWSESLGILILAQCLHAMSFGAMHAAAIHFVHERFSAHEQGKAQALYSSLSFGLGGAIGAIVSAFVVVRYGYASAFLFSALVSFSAYVVLALARKHKILH